MTRNLNFSAQITLKMSAKCKLANRALCSNIFYLFQSGNEVLILISQQVLIFFFFFIITAALVQNSSSSCKFFHINAIVLIHYILYSSSIYSKGTYMAEHVHNLRLIISFV